jgi:hypothetical protein
MLGKLKKSGEDWVIVEGGFFRSLDKGSKKLTCIILDRAFGTLILRIRKNEIMRIFP